MLDKTTRSLDTNTPYVGLKQPVCWIQTHSMLDTNTYMLDANSPYDVDTGML